MDRLKLDAFTSRYIKHLKDQLIPITIAEVPRASLSWLDDDNDDGGNDNDSNCKRF